MYNYPYYVPYGNMGRVPLFGRMSNFFKSLKLGPFIDNTSKTLNVVNQAIPLVRNVRPMISNIKDVIRVSNIIKSNDHHELDEGLGMSEKDIKKETKTVIDDKAPTFFVS